MNEAEKILLNLAAVNECVCVVCSDAEDSSHRVAWKLHSDGFLSYDYTHKAKPRAFFKITPRGLKEIKHEK